MERTVEIITRATIGSFDIKSEFVWLYVPEDVPFSEDLGKSIPSYLFVWV